MRAPFSSPLLLGALLWVGLTLSINAPSWLHCGLGMVDRSCLRDIPWQAAQVGAAVGGMLLCVGLGMRLMPPAPGRRRLMALSALDIVAALVGLLCTATVLMIWRGPNIGHPSAYTLQILLMQSVCMVATYEYMGRARQNRSSAAQLDLQQQQLAQQIDAARLQLLQAQVEPHFLFNTLAHLRRLAQTDPREAHAMLGDLLEYLGEALPELREAQSTLERELRLVRAFLALHQRRMGATRLRFHFDIEPGLEHAQLPATALLTLAENAIKHGIAPLVTGGSVQISARLDGEQLLLEHADTGSGMSASSGHGTGLATLRARLKAMYGEAGSISLRVNQPRGLVVTLRLPLQHA